MSLLSGSPLALGCGDRAEPPLSPTFARLIAPLEAQLPHLTPVVSRSNRPLSFTFDYQVRALVYYHTEAATSAQDLLHTARCDPFVHHLIVPEDGLGESTFYEANATRGSQPMLELIDRLSKKVAKHLKVASPELGELVALDGTLLDASLSMTWAEYTTAQRKAKLHVGFDLNRGLPRTLALTDGNGAERAFVPSLVNVGQTGVIDRGYQDHHKFDQWIEEEIHFVARLRKNTQHLILEELPFPSGTAIFFFAKVLLGDDAHRMQHPVLLVGFRSRGHVYWIATDRTDLTAEQIAFIFSLRWAIEVFFAWWKRHLKVYHLISRNRHGVLLQLLAGVITSLLLVLYCHQHYGERPSLRRLREVRWQIRHETAPMERTRLSIIILLVRPLPRLLFLWPYGPAIF